MQLIMGIIIEGNVQHFIFLPSDGYSQGRQVGIIFKEKFRNIK